jgi:histidinol-phosphate phosphatase family protein
MMNTGKAAVFLDRDGTIIEEVGYLDRVDKMIIIPQAPPAIRLLNEAGFLVIVVTNQSGVARGFFPESLVLEAHRYLAELLWAEGARIDGFYFCPHHPEEGTTSYRQVCSCRKPAPGMLLAACQDFSLDLGRSFLVGDNWSDLAAARAAGVRGILVRTGYGGEVPPEQIMGDHVTAHIGEAARWIIKEGRP